MLRLDRCRAVKKKKNCWGAVFGGLSGVTDIITTVREHLKKRLMYT